MEIPMRLVILEVLAQVKEVLVMVLMEEVSQSRQIFKQDCNEYGLVVVRIEVNRQGKVIAPIPGDKGTTNTHPCLLEPAKKIAISHKWPPMLMHLSKQIGFVSINFDLSQ